MKRNPVPRKARLTRLDTARFMLGQAFPLLVLSLLLLVCWSGRGFIIGGSGGHAELQADPSPLNEMRISVPSSKS